MSELIDVETDSWDEQLITEFFWPIDARRILNIPLARNLMEDFVGGHYTKSGVFSVRSCYHMEWEHQHGRKLRRTSGFGSLSTLPIWKTLWSLNVPAKIKIHCWRALLGAIPCNGVLANRHIQPMRCALSVTSNARAFATVFFLCPRVREIWKLLGMEDIITQVCTVEIEGRSALEALLRDRDAKATLLAQVDRNDLVAIAVWYIS